MILTLDIGNSQVHGGVFNSQSELLMTFRKRSKTGSSSDEFGLFLRSVLRENNIDPQLITSISLCSVVPEVLHSISSACIKYFNLKPFILQAGTKTGLKINYRNPLEVGSDRIANAIAATKKYPNQNLIIIDFGTATTFCAVSKSQVYLGGVILSGIKLSMESLEQKTSKLPSVLIKKMNTTLGRSTIESIQSGLFYGSLGAIKEVTHRLKKECFSGEATRVVATGGLSSLFHDQNVFDEFNSSLVLEGLYQAYHLNKKDIKKTLHNEVPLTL